MKLLATGILSNVSGGYYYSGVSSPVIDASQRESNTLSAWLSIEGDLGRTGGSVAVFVKGAYQKSGVTYALPENSFLVKGGSSISNENGCYLCNFTTDAPFIRLGATASGSGSTIHGSATTNNAQVRYAVCAV